MFIDSLFHSYFLCTHRHLLNASLVPDVLVDLGMGCESSPKVSALRELSFLCRKGMMSAVSKGSCIPGYRPSASNKGQGDSETVCGDGT